MFRGVWGGIRPKHWILTKKSICAPTSMCSGRGNLNRKGVIRWVGWGMLEGLSCKWVMPEVDGPIYVAVDTFPSFC